MSLRTFASFELGKRVSWEVIRSNNRADDVCVQFGTDHELQLCFASSDSARKFCQELAQFLEQDDEYRAHRAKVFAEAKLAEVKEG
jgi:D-hexose-6-phosphate mutarotase